MAVEAVSQFFQAIAQDQSLQAELLQAMQSENDRVAVTELANHRGFNFTSEELWAEVQKRQAEFEQRQQAGELTDEELEAVSGGITPTFFVLSAIIVASASATGGAVYARTQW